MEMDLGRSWARENLDFRIAVETTPVREPMVVMSGNDAIDLLGLGVHDDELCGVVGLEVYGSCALLRSLAVAPGHRNDGIGGNAARPFPPVRSAPSL